MHKTLESLNLWVCEGRDHLKLADRKHYGFILNVISLQSERAMWAEGGAPFELEFTALNLLELRSKSYWCTISEELSPLERQVGAKESGPLFDMSVTKPFSEVWNKPE